MEVIFKVVWPFRHKKRHSTSLLYLDLCRPRGVTRPKRALVYILKCILFAEWYMIRSVGKLFKWKQTGRPKFCICFEILQSICIDAVRWYLRLSFPFNIESQLSSYRLRKMDSESRQTGKVWFGLLLVLHCPGLIHFFFTKLISQNVPFTFESLTFFMQLCLWWQSCDNNTCIATKITL